MEYYETEKISVYRCDGLYFYVLYDFLVRESQAFCLSCLLYRTNASESTLH